MAEIRYGIERLPGGQRRDLLAATAADRERAGTPISGFDGRIAAICHAHGAILASRNRKDFDGTGLQVVDPWEA